MPVSPPDEILYLFDAKWYSEYYPDIGASKVDPLLHFKNNGWKEGRWPCAFESVVLDNQLWANDNVDEVTNRLQEIAKDNQNSEQGLAIWFLCRWLASYGEWQTAIDYIGGLFNNEILLELIPHDGAFVLAFSVYYHCDDIENALSILNNQQWTSFNNKALATSMLKKSEEKIASINEVFERSGLIQLVEKSTGLDNLSTSAAEHTKVNHFSPLISIIVPCYNAEKTISTAINSLLKQTYPKIEVIVVDDASSDETDSVVNSFCKKDPRVKYIKHPENKGAYAARNNGLRIAKGQFITTHDADDWSHPQKVEKQLQVLKENRKVKASVSHWVRATPDLKFERWRIEDGWIYRNVSSLMFRRSVFRKLGYWDSVSVNADTEYYFRILSKFGNNAIKEVLPGVPLAFGRVVDDSLTQVSTTHIRTQYSGIRKEYNDAANEWHTRSRNLYMPKDGLRKFTAPPLICRGSIESKKENLKNVIQAKGIFDSSWYLAAYPDIAAAGVDPFKHFIKHGLDEGRDPNPILSISGLAFINKTSHFDAISSMASGVTGKNDLLSIDGLIEQENSKTLLMVAHLAGNELFGAERSFLDCIQMLQSEKVNIVVVLPSGVNHNYVSQVQASVKKIYFTPLPWWRGDRLEIQKVTNQVISIIEENEISAVYVNTLTLLEPHIAAKKCGISSIMHVRELPNHDIDLCKRLVADQLLIKKHIDTCADIIIANSQVTANFIEDTKKTTVIYNAVDIAKFSGLVCKPATDHLNVVMISSNTIKKGIDDLFKLADRCAIAAVKARFFIWGPQTEALKERLAAYQYDNLTYCGYAADPTEAYKDMHIVLNLSHFQESFGRTVIEGLASGCIPVAYSWGAIKEVVEGYTSHLVEFGRWDKIPDILDKIKQENGPPFKISRKELDLLREQYGTKSISKKMKNVLCLDN